ncbi:MAG TPA: PqqD family peptide modification chaperone [Catenuloplanes sp.]|jgi:ABC-type multidrug transport system fused ATPase/permease subunit
MVEQFPRLVRGWARGTLTDAPGVRLRLVGLAALGLLQGLLETAIIVQVTAIAFAATGGRRVHGLPLIGDLGWSPAALVGAVAATTAVTAGVRWSSERLIATVSTDAIVRVRTRLLDAYCRASYLEQAAQRAGTLQELFTSSALVVGQSTLTASAALVATAQLLVLAGAAVSISPLAAVGVLVVGALGVVVAHPFRTRTRQIAKAAAGANSELAALVAETTQLGRDLRVNGVHQRVAERARRPVRDAAQLVSRVRLESRLVPATTRDLTIVCVAAGLGLLSQFSAVTVGALGATALLLVRAIGYGQQVSTAVQSMADRRVNVDLLAATLARFEQAAPPSGGARLRHVGTVRFDDVTFTYPDADRPVLHRIAFSLRPGEVVGVVGASGAGKSTLLHLLLGLIRPSGGMITAGDLDLAGVDLDDWLRRIAYVAQEPRLLTGTVAENIRFLRDGIDDAAVERAARDAALTPDLALWPAGLDHPVGPLGAAVSGGQRQRIALARALAGAPELLILDEPTSALDAASEAAVLATIAAAPATTTVVLVAHRPSSVRSCDRVIRVQDGRVVSVDPVPPPGDGHRHPATKHRGSCQSVAVLTESSIIVRSAEPLTAAVDDEIVMLSPEQGAYFGLNPSGSRVWELIGEARSVGGVCAALTAEFDVDDHTCRTEVLEFLHGLQEARLIEVRA